MAQGQLRCLSYTLLAEPHSPTAKLCSKKVCYWAIASALWFSVQEGAEFIEL